MEPRVHAALVLGVVSSSICRSWCCRLSRPLTGFASKGVPTTPNDGGGDPPPRRHRSGEVCIGSWGTTERRCPMTTGPMLKLDARNRVRAALVLAGALVLASAVTWPVVLAWTIVIVGTCVLTRQIELGKASFVAHRHGRLPWSAASRWSAPVDDLHARLDRALDRLAAGAPETPAQATAPAPAPPRIRSHRVATRVSYERGVRARTTCTPVLRISSDGSVAARRPSHLVGSKAP